MQTTEPVTAPDNSPADSVAADKWATLQFWLALLISAGPMPLAWIRLQQRWLLRAEFGWDAAAVLACLVGCVAWLARGAQHNRRLSTPALLFAMLFVWTLVTAAIVWRHVDTRSPMIATVTTMAAAGFGLGLLSWAAGWPRCWGTCVLALAMMLPYWGLLQPKGTYGDGDGVIAWRRTGLFTASGKPRTSRAPGVDEAAMSSKAPEPQSLQGQTHTVAAAAIGAADHSANGSAHTLPTVQLTDFPQLLGPNRDGVIAGVSLSGDWQANPPEQQWRRPIGMGWSGIAIAGQRVLTMEQHGSDESVTAWTLHSGQQLWQHTDAARFAAEYGGGKGPRATPTVANDRVFAVSPCGRLSCLDLKTGHLNWQAQIQPPDAEARLHGVVGSPLVLDDLVIVAATAANTPCLHAFQVTDGTLAWSGGQMQGSYSSPFVISVGDASSPDLQIGLFATEGVIAVDARDGTQLWNHAWPNADGTHVAQPIQLIGPTEGSDRAGPIDLVLTTGYGKGATRINVGWDGNAWQPQRQWATQRMQTKFTTAVRWRNELIGLSNGILESLDLNSGRRHWKAGRYGHGQILLVDQQMLVMTEAGELLLLELHEQRRPTIAGRWPVFDDKAWSIPSLSGPYLVVRNDRELVCLRLPLE